MQGKRHDWKTCIIVLSEVCWNTIQRSPTPEPTCYGQVLRSCAFLELAQHSLPLLPNLPVPNGCRSNCKCRDMKFTCRVRYTPMWGMYVFIESKLKEVTSRWLICITVSSAKPSEK